MGGGVLQGHSLGQELPLSPCHCGAAAGAPFLAGPWLPMAIPMHPGLWACPWGPVLHGCPSQCAHSWACLLPSPGALGPPASEWIFPASVNKWWQCARRAGDRRGQHRSQGVPSTEAQPLGAAGRDRETPRPRERRERVVRDTQIQTSRPSEGWLGPDGRGTQRSLPCLAQPPPLPLPLQDTST